MENFMLLVLSTLASYAVFAQPFITEGRKPLAVIPAQTNGVAKAVVSLNGNWEINMNPAPETWKSNEGKWGKITVPGEPAMQGFKVTNDKEFFYRTTIMIPPDAKNKTIMIRFNGVYSYARVFVNGHFAREHFGGFTAWEVDISNDAMPGKPATIYVGVTDRADDISYASGYAHHPIGGILREVQMLVLPKAFINRLYAQTDFTSDFKQATLSLNVSAALANNNSKVQFQLLDAKSKPVFLQMQSFELAQDGSGKYSVNVTNPVLWNEETPYLYTLKAALVTNGKTTETIEQKIGFRKVEVNGRQVLVNGQPIKLRGACRHDMHPLFGRSTNRYYDSLDVVLAKEANVNFIRTSHYPPSKDFLEFADRFGLYIEEETAICFVNDWREGIYKKSGLTYDDTSFTSRYLGQLSEMIDRDRNHAAVIIWSIGNESTYGTNFQKEYAFVKSIDLSRPVSWTWPGSALKENKRCFDIAVAHYPGYDGKEDDNFGLHYKNMEHESLPLLSDEWAHVACYNLTLLKDDPNVKDFWGRGLDSMWANRFDVPGNLGGAIWGMTDETFHLPDTVTGYGPWGFIDVWRRKKTEFWNVKKAYSPVKVLQTQFPQEGKNKTLRIPIKNRFNHSLLNEITLKVTQNGKSTTQMLPALKPHEEGKLIVQTNGTTAPLLLQFWNKQHHLIDEELISFTQEKPSLIKSLGKWSVSRPGKTLSLTNGNLNIQLDTATGQLITASVNKQTVITGGIRVIVKRPKDPGAFKESEAIMSGNYLVSAASVKMENKGKVIVTSTGWVSNYPVKMETAYYADGTIGTTYEADSIPPYTWQVGIALPITHEIDAIQWNRKGYWSTYPAHHLSANAGSAKRISNITEHYRVAPKYEIALGMYDYYLTGTNTAEKANMHGSEAYRATKENIVGMQLQAQNKTWISLHSNGQQAAKMNILANAQQELIVLDKWDYWTLSWGNFAGNKNSSSHIKGSVMIHLNVAQKN